MDRKNMSTRTDLGRETTRESDRQLDGLSSYERKSVLVNRELDAMGMGRYSWYIFFLCGFGYMLDLLWAEAFGLIVTPAQQELGFSGTLPCPRLARLH